ncbi:hypothetical protein HD806DRAFT_553254 [Xylariaceae sp. AK1471]|nr:hypothetical protein HD806DRAFT_553254 [Xylariaceae sp. AK1471]
MHSYGGQVGTNALTGMSAKSRAARGLKGSVCHLIYTCAFLLPENTSVIDKVTEMGHLDLIPITYDIAADGATVERSPRERLLGAWHNDPEAEVYVATFKIWNGNAMWEKINKCARREIPVTYVYTSEDSSIPLTYQESRVENLRAEGVDVKTETLETGHSPHLTKHKELLDIVIRVASL